LNVSQWIVLSRYVDIELATALWLYI